MNDLTIMLVLMTVLASHSHVASDCSVGLLEEAVKEALTPCTTNLYIFVIWSLYLSLEIWTSLTRSSSPFFADPFVAFTPCTPSNTEFVISTWDSSHLAFQVV